MSFIASWIQSNSEPNLHAKFAVDAERPNNSRTRRRRARAEARTARPDEEWPVSDQRGSAGKYHAKFARANHPKKFHSREMRSRITHPPCHVIAWRASALR